MKKDNGVVVVYLDGKKLKVHSIAGSNAALCFQHAEHSRPSTISALVLPLRRKRTSGRCAKVARLSRCASMVSSLPKKRRSEHLWKTRGGAPPRPPKGAGDAGGAGGGGEGVASRVGAVGRGDEGAMEGAGIRLAAVPRRALAPEVEAEQPLDLKGGGAVEQ